MFYQQNLYIFFIASLLLNLTPGNDMIYVASRSISQGIKAGIISAIGVFIGCFNKNIVALPPIDKWKLLKQGIITNALNPKVALFFLSFLPQFIQVSSPLYKVQLFTLGLWFDVQGTLVLMIVAWLIGKAGNFIKNNQKFWNMQEKITGIILIGLGIKVALASKKIS